MAGPRKSRLCVGCNEFHQKEELLRVVKHPTMGVMVDPAGKLPGRGVYICRNAECLNLAIKRNSFRRSLQTDIPQAVVSDLYEEIAIEK